MLMKIIVGLLLVLIIMFGIVIVSTLITFVQIVKEAKSISSLQQDIKSVQLVIDEHYKRREYDLLGQEQSKDN